jgi:CspA family cold shock protein
MSSERLIGRVKWFNNKSGFGFIAISNGYQKGKDIFAHYSAITSSEQSQYRYLVQGEYVELDLIKSDNNQHEYHSANITGILGGILMCETHRLNEQSNLTRGQRRPRENYVPRINSDNGMVEGFTEVKKRPKSAGKNLVVSTTL